MVLHFCSQDRIATWNVASSGAGLSFQSEENVLVLGEVRAGS